MHETAAAGVSFGSSGEGGGGGGGVSSGPGMVLDRGLPQRLAGAGGSGGG